MSREDKLIAQLQLQFESEKLLRIDAEERLLSLRQKYADARSTMRRKFTEDLQRFKETGSCNNEELSFNHENRMYSFCLLAAVILLAFFIYYAYY